MTSCFCCVLNWNSCCACFSFFKKWKPLCQGNPNSVSRNAQDHFWHMKLYQLCSLAQMKLSGVGLGLLELVLRCQMHILLNKCFVFHLMGFWLRWPEPLGIKWGLKHCTKNHFRGSLQQKPSWVVCGSELERTDCNESTPKLGVSELLGRLEEFVWTWVMEEGLSGTRGHSSGGLRALAGRERSCKNLCVALGIRNIDHAFPEGMS